MILRFDSVGGASGDMILGVLVDLGAELSALEPPLRSLGLPAFELRAEAAVVSGIAGTRLTVSAPEEATHRHLSDIVGMLEASELPGEVRSAAARVFRRLAEAEGAVHGIDPERVHFHEVGAADSILDIAGACLGLHLLGVSHVAVGPLPTGQGTVHCAHGLYPLPAPATLRLLQGLPVVSTDEPYELVTPTGAALLSSWRDLEAVPDGAAAERTGYGFGQRTLRDRPNLLRGTLYRAPPDSGRPRDATGTCRVLECNLDDTTPELIGALSDRLLRAGP